MSLNRAFRLQSDFLVEGSMIERRTLCYARLPRLSAAVIEVAVFGGLSGSAPSAASQIASPTSDEWESITFAIQSSTGLDVRSKTATTFGTPTYATWNNDTAQHATFELSDEEMNIAPGQYNISLRVINEGGDDYTVGSGRLDIYDTANQSSLSVADLGDGAPITVSQADARYSPIGVGGAAALTEIYSSTDGSDLTGDGTVGLPVLTPNKAYELAQAALPSSSNPVSVRVTAGIHTISTSIAASDQWISIQGDGSKQTILSFTGSAVLTVSAGNRNISGVTLRRSGSGTAAVLHVPVTGIASYLDNLVFSDVVTENSNTASATLAVQTISGVTENCSFTSGGDYAVDWSYGCAHRGLFAQGNLRAIRHAQSCAPHRISTPAETRKSSFDGACKLQSVALTGGCVIESLVESSTGERGVNGGNTGAQQVGVAWHPTILAAGIQILGPSCGQQDGTPATSCCMRGTFDAIGAFVEGDTISDGMHDGYFSAGKISCQVDSGRFLDNQDNMTFTSVNVITAPGSVQRIFAINATSFNGCSFENDARGYLGTAIHRCTGCKDNTNGPLGADRDDLALKFDGTTNCYAQVSDNTYFNYSTSGNGMTIEFRIKTTTASATVGIMSYLSGSNDGWAFYFEGNGGASTLHFLSNNSYLTKNLSGINDGNWHSIRVVMKGTSRRMFIDGVSVANDTGITSSTGTKRLVLGGLTTTLASSGGTIYGFAGELAQVVIWNIPVISVAAASYEQGPPTVRHPNMLAWYGPTTEPHADNGTIYWSDQCGRARATLFTNTVVPVWSSHPNNYGTPGVDTGNKFSELESVSATGGLVLTDGTTRWRMTIGSDGVPVFTSL